MYVSKRVTVNTTAVPLNNDIEGEHMLHLRVSGGSPVTLGDSGISYGSAWLLQPSTDTVLRLQQGEVLFAVAQSGNASEVSVLAYSA